MRLCRHLQDWVEEDQGTFGRYKALSAPLTTKSTSLQAAMFEVQFKGVDGLENAMLLYPDTATMYYVAESRTFECCRVSLSLR